MKIKIFCLVLLSVVSSRTNMQAQDLQEKHSIEYSIKAVENSLSPIVRMAGEPLWNMEKRMQEYNLAGLSIAVINNYQIEWAKGYGLTNIATENKVTTETVFQAASISKTINAVALLKLAELQKVSLDAEINTLLTSWKFPYNKNISTTPITLRQLLSHTAGLSTHGFNGYKNFNHLPSIIEILDGRKPANSDKVVPVIPPNQEFKYSGGGTMVTQLILSDNQSLPYEQFVKNHIFQPLQMNHSFYSNEPNKYPNEIATGHVDSGKPLENDYNIYPESAAAGLWTTPTDLSKLLIDIQLSLTRNNSKILTGFFAEEMTSPTKDGMAALGLFIENQNGEKYIQHSGANRGFRGKFYAGLSNGKGVVIMVNGTNTEIIEEIIRSVALVYDWPGFDKLESSSELSITEADLKRYVGTYTLNKREVIISLEDGRLVATEKRKWTSQLTPLNESSFVVDIVKPQTTIEFVGDEKGVINKLITQQGESFEWTKVK